ncbi:GntR family transcriptional regulator OS=Streptomyces tendae OX=1932 GN=F3L20_00330 PE=4 SV=1 [Streptomyces tendae]
MREAAEGLIKLYPKKGALVLPVSAQEIADVVETRLLVEEHAARKAVPAPPGLLARLEELLARQKEEAAAGDFAAASVTDRCFHAEIVRSGGNEILSRLYDQLRDRQLRMGQAVMHSHPDRVNKTLTEHEEILRALRSGDADAAVDAVHRHVGWFSHLARGEVR